LAAALIIVNEREVQGKSARGLQVFRRFFGVENRSETWI
jgi:hypothetical protein